MILKAFSILDTKANIFNTPFLMRSTGEAVRAFSDLCNDPQSAINKHPDDYRLFYCGDFDQDHGTFDKLDRPQPLGAGSEYVTPSKQLQLLPNVEQAS